MSGKEKRLIEENKQLQEDNEHLREVCLVQQRTIARLWDAYNSMLDEKKKIG